MCSSEDWTKASLDFLGGKDGITDEFDYRTVCLHILSGILFSVRWNRYTISCTSSFLQKGALTAMDCVEETEQMRQAYEKRKNLLVKGIREIPGVELLTPAGAFYAWVKFDTDMDSETLCNDLLDKEKIAGVPGIAYGEEDCVCIRFSFAASEDVLRTMLERLKTYQTTHNDL